MRPWVLLFLRACMRPSFFVYPSYSPGPPFHGTRAGAPPPPSTAAWTGSCSAPPVEVKRQVLSSMHDATEGRTLPRAETGRRAKRAERIEDRCSRGWVQTWSPGPLSWLDRGGQARYTGFDPQTHGMCEAKRNVFSTCEDGRDGL